jgi:hypothetical protein
MTTILANGVTLVHTEAGDPDAPPMVHGAGNGKAS